jgi:hypothetical protein
VEGLDKGGWVKYKAVCSTGLSAAIFFADEDRFEDADEDIPYGFCGAHLELAAI